MRWNIRSVLFVISALLLALSNKRPNTSKNEGHDGKDEATSVDHRQEPTTEMLRAEWQRYRARSERYMKAKKDTKKPSA
jgi:hypothetical protein